MGVFLGSGSKEGKGVSKDQREKKRFFQFFDIYFRKIGKLIQLNLLFLLFSLPIITIGPSFAATVKIAKYFNEGKPVFLFSDFLNAFKENFKQGFIFSLINGILCAGCVQAFIYYMVKFYGGEKLYIIPVIIVVVLLAIIVFANFYIHLIMVTVNLGTIAILKNSILLMVLGARTNIITMFFTILISVSLFLLFPISLILIVPLGFSTIALLWVFNGFQYVYKYLVKPYYEMNNLENPYEQKVAEDEAVFTDTI